MAPPYDTIDVVIGAVVSRLDKAEGDVNELHAKQREAVTKTDQLLLHADDFKTRIRTLEAHQQKIFENHNSVTAKVEMVESKLDDLKSNVTKVIEGQMQILNSNMATREEFQGVLAKQGTQHLEKMKRLRHIIYIGGPVLFLLVNWWAAYTGQQTLIESVFKFVAGGQP